MVMFGLGRAPRTPRLPRAGPGIPWAEALRAGGQPTWRGPWGRRGLEGIVQARGTAQQSWRLGREGRVPLFTAHSLRTLPLVYGSLIPRKSPPAATSSFPSHHPPPHPLSREGAERRGRQLPGESLERWEPGNGPCSVPGKARLWESHPQPPPQDATPDARDRSLLPKRGLL